MDRAISTRSTSDPQPLTDFVGRVVALVLHYDRPHLTFRCIETLANQSASPRVIVIDNSRNLNAETVQRVAPGSAVITPSVNLGYARGYNFGMQWLVSHSATTEYTLICNNDVNLLSPTTLATLCRDLSSRPMGGGIQPRLRNPTGIFQGPYGESNIYVDTLQFLVPPVWYALRRLRQRNIQRIDSVVPCFRPMGSCFLVRTAAFLNSGMFDEQTFMYREEEILAHRMSANGYRFYYTPHAEALHDHATGPELAAQAAAEEYFFCSIQKAPRSWFKMRQASARIYYRCWHPLRKHFGIR